jgi:hypothetical protein
VEEEEELVVEVLYLLYFIITLVDVDDDYEML